MFRTAIVEISPDDAADFCVGAGLTVCAAQRAGLDVAAHWQVDEVSHDMLRGQMVSRVKVRRHVDLLKSKQD